MKRLLCGILSVMLVLSMSVTAAASEATETYEEAILYHIDEDGILEFNVVHTADLTGAEIVDLTDSGIDTIDRLKEIMGTPDAPAPVHGTDVGERTLGQAVWANLEIDDDNTVTKVTVTDIRQRPVVGISWKNDNINKDYIGFAEAFERNGAYAVYLPQVSSSEEAQAVLEQLDGLFQTGGEDWNPSLYDEEQLPHGSVRWNDARDTSDIHMMQQAVAMDVPMLAVCRGAQGFNVAMGGGLIQDIPYYLGLKVLAGEIDEDRVSEVIADNGYQKWDSETQTYVPVPADECDHLRVYVDGLKHSTGSGYHELGDDETIGIDPDSKWLYDIIGSTSMELVATAHHQAVNPEKLGDGLTIVANSSDGIVEAIEHQDSLFALGVQWHPERDALKDSNGSGVNLDECNALLRALVKYAGIYADNQEEESNLQLTTDAHLVLPGDYVDITTAFIEPVNSNTAILNYTFDTKLFQLADFHPSDGVNVISKEATDTGAKVIFMIPSYNTEGYGQLSIQAKPDALLSRRWQTVKADVEYVVINEDGEKEIQYASASTAFTTIGMWVEGDTNGDRIVDLLDLSNMIDWFGIDSSDSRWDSWYTYFDFNNNKEIDITDIVFVAQKIK